MNDKRRETYLGAGVYATFDGYQIWLDCRPHAPSIGPSGTPSIALDVQVIRELVRFMDGLIAEVRA